MQLSEDNDARRLRGDDVRLVDDRVVHAHPRVVGPNQLCDAVASMGPIQLAWKESKDLLFYRL